MFSHEFAEFIAIRTVGCGQKYPTGLKTELQRRDATHPTSRIQKVAELGLKFESLDCWFSAHSSKPHCSFFFFFFPSSIRDCEHISLRMIYRFIGRVTQQSSEVQTIEMKSCIKLYKKYVY